VNCCWTHAASATRLLACFHPTRHASPAARLRAGPYSCPAMQARCGGREASATSKAMARTAPTTLTAHARHMKPTRSPIQLKTSSPVTIQLGNRTPGGMLNLHHGHARCCVRRVALCLRSRLHAGCRRARSSGRLSKNPDTAQRSSLPTTSRGRSLVARVARPGAARGTVRPSRQRRSRNGGGERARQRRAPSQRGPTGARA